MLTHSEFEELSAIKNAVRDLSNPTYEQKRYEIAKDCLAGMVGSSYLLVQHDYKKCVGLAVWCADELLKQLEESK